MSATGDQTDQPRTDPALVARLRDDLAAAGYTVDAVEERLGPVAAGALAREQPVPARRALERLAATDPLDPVTTLASAFVLGRPASRKRLAAALPTAGIEGAERLGLVAADGAADDDTGDDDAVRPLVDLRPYAAQDAAGRHDWWVASDLDELATGRPLREDHVLGIGGASTMLAATTIRRPVGRVLDLGTGCGVQALHARRHSQAVVATDISARALAFARLNLALDDHPTPVDLRRGSLLEPVAAEQFDLVVSNPPFVITPRTADVPAYEYRDGGMVGDALVERLVTTVGPALAEGGVVQLLGNWEHRRGEGWRDRVAAWLDASGLDGWVVQREVQDVAQYAETWIRDGGVPDPDRYAALYRAWLDDFEARGVEAVGFGIVTLRRPAGLDAATGADDAAASGRPLIGRPRLRRVEECLGPVTGPLGAHLADCLDALDAVLDSPPAEVLARIWQVAEDVTEERYHRPGEEDPAVILLRQGGGFGRAVPVTGTVAAVVGACDGELPLDRIVGAVAHLLEEPVDDVAAQVLRFLDDELVAGGLLRPAPTPG